MINHIWTVVCTDVVIDSRTNNLSMHNVLEQITVMGEPKQETAIPLNHAVVTLLENVEKNTLWIGMIRLSFITPSGKEIIKLESGVNLSEHKRYRHIGNIQGLPTVEPGRHVYRVELRSESENEWTFICDIPLELSFKSSNPPEDIMDNR
jgi:hypothetical protein